MDIDGEEEWPSGCQRVASSDVIKNLLEIANSRPGTNVAKAIVAYYESPGLSTLLLVLEEVSKNTDFSTDLRLSLSYYMDEFLRHATGSIVPRRSIIAAAGSVLQYCSKIYGDRVELLFQVVQHQIEALLMANPKNEETTNNNQDTNKTEEPRKRKMKKLTQKEFDPFSYRMEPKRFKVMSDDKRYSRSGFEPNKNRNRTIEHMYQEHTPAHLWKYASIVDPNNPYEQDEKKNYKVFTYHPEPRYNTLLPDIQFDRLKLIKEYVHRNRVEMSSCLKKDMSNKEYLDEYIALENQMLASRYGEKGLLKRALALDANEQARRLSMKMENLQKHLLECFGRSPKRIRLTTNEDRDTNYDNDRTDDVTPPVSMDSALGDSLRSTIPTDVSGVQLDNSDFSMNDASCLDSTRLDQQQQQQSGNHESRLELSGKADQSHEQSLQIDSGIGMDDVCDTLPAAQSFDDEGVVLTDLIDEQRLLSLSPKVMVQDILPGVPDKANLSVRIDAEMMALVGINETHEESVMVQRDVHHTIQRNFLQLPEKKIRKTCLFKLTKDFDLFMKARKPTKRQVEPKSRAPLKAVSVGSPTHSSSSLEVLAAIPLDQMEFDSEQNFLGFRRPTYDSGIEQEELRMAISPADDGIIVDVDIKGEPDMNGVEDAPHLNEIQQARASHQAENDISLPEISTTNITASNVIEHNDILNSMDSIDDNISALEASAENTSHLENGESELYVAPMVTPIVDTEVEEDWDAQSESFEENCNSIDAETDAKIIDWHRRLAPTLEAAHARQNFSIQDLNDEIIAKCQANGGKATLADVVQNKDPTKLCCYMLSSLLLTNQRNVDLQIDRQEQNHPIEMFQFKMKLISTERKQLNPEDDIGNINTVNQSKKPALAANTQAAKITKSIQTLNVKAVQLIKPVPKASHRPEDADSGISSLPSSSVST